MGDNLYGRAWRVPPFDLQYSASSELSALGIVFNPSIFITGGFSDSMSTCFLILSSEFPIR